MLTLSSVLYIGNYVLVLFAVHTPLLLATRSADGRGSAGAGGGADGGAGGDAISRRQLGGLDAIAADCANLSAWLAGRIGGAHGGLQPDVVGAATRGLAGWNHLCRRRIWAGLGRRGAGLHAACRLGRLGRHQVLVGAPRPLGHREDLQAEGGRPPPWLARGGGGRRAAGLPGEHLVHARRPDLAGGMRMAHACAWRTCGVCMARAWRVHGVCMACAWRVRGVCVACAHGGASVALIGGDTDAARPSTRRHRLTHSLTHARASGGDADAARHCVPRAQRAAVGSPVDGGLAPA